MKQNLMEFASGLDLTWHWCPMSGSCTTLLISCTIAAQFTGWLRLNSQTTSSSPRCTHWTGLVLQSILGCKCLRKALSVVRCSYTFLCQEDPAAEAIPVPYRYSMTPGRNGICNVFKPNMLAHGDTVRPGLFLQQFLDCSRGFFNHSVHVCPSQGNM